MIPKIPENSCSIHAVSYFWLMGQKSHSVAPIDHLYTQPGSPSTISNMSVYVLNHFVIKGWQHRPKETTFFEMVATTSMVYRYIPKKMNQKNIEVVLQCHLMVRSSSHGLRYLENSRTLDCIEIGTENPLVVNESMFSLFTS